MNIEDVREYALTQAGAHEDMKQGKRTIVMGASSGIGLEVAKLLMRQGWSVGVAARRVELLQDLGAAAVECIDVTKDDATEALQRLIRKLGGMDLYFHASGIGKQNRELAADIELATVETNGVGFTRMIGDFHYPLMLRPEKVAREIVSAINHRRHIRIIDWKYRILTALWRRIPRWVWRRIKL